jgi:hypothetical protein
MYLDDDADYDSAGDLVRFAYAIRLSMGMDNSPPEPNDMDQRYPEPDWDNVDDWDYGTLDVTERWKALSAAEQHGFTHYTFALTAGKPGEDNEWMKGLDWTRIYNEKPVTDAQQAPALPDDGLSRLLRQAQACHAEYERQKKELRPCKERMKVGKFTVIDRLSV